MKKLLALCLVLLLLPVLARAEEEYNLPFTPYVAPIPVPQEGLRSRGAGDLVITGSADGEYQTGTEYTFAAKALSGIAPYTYRFEVRLLEDNLLKAEYIQKEFSESASFKWTFYDNETYYITVRARDAEGRYVLGSENPYSHVVIRPEGTDYIQAKVDELASRCRQEAGYTKAERALWMHDWLTQNNYYDTNYNIYGPYGVLLWGTGVCDSYSKAYVKLLDALDIEVLRVTSRPMNHAWNEIRLDDGEWYQVDVTWDDPAGSAERISGSENHMHFALPDSAMQQNHDYVVGTDSLYPCTSWTYTWNLRNEQYNKWIAQIRTEIESQLNNGETDFSVQTPFYYTNEAGTKKIRTSGFSVAWYTTAYAIESLRIPFGSGGSLLAAEYIKENTNNTGGTIRFIVVNGLQEAWLSVPAGGYVYTGEAILPDDLLPGLTKDKDYVIEAANNTAKGTASFTIRGIHAYSGELIGTFEIVPLDLSGSDVVIEVADAVYQSGNPVAPAVLVKAGDHVIPSDQYTIAAADTSEAGGPWSQSGTVTLTGATDNVTGSVTRPFRIVAVDLSGAEITLDGGPFTYSGNAQEPGVTVTRHGTILTKGEHYTVSYANNINASTEDSENPPTVTIHPVEGKSVGTKDAYFTIQPKPLGQDDYSIRSNGSVTVYYDGTGIESPWRIQLNADGQWLERGVDYTERYENNIAAGEKTAKAYYTFTGNYVHAVGTGWNYSFTISALPLSQARLACDGPVYYTGSAQTPQVYLIYNGHEIPESDYQISYSDNTEIGTATVIVTAASANVTGSVSGTFEIKEIPVENLSVTLENNVYTYTGEQIKPAVTSVTALIGSETVEFDENDYYVDYGENLNAGTGTVNVTLKGIYEGNHTAEFEITAASIAEATVHVNPASAVYTGSAIEPAVAVTVGERPLTGGTDYTVAYANNINAGTANVIVTGSGNYAGTASGGFTIAAASLEDAIITQAEGPFIYTGRAFEPAVAVTLGGTVLTADDYAVAYKDNVNIGTATITVTPKAGNPNLTGSFETTFQIVAPSVPDVPADKTAVLPSALTALQANAMAGAVFEAVDLSGTKCGFIGSKAFLNCKQLKLVRLPAGAVTIVADAFDGCEPGLFIVVPAGGSLSVTGCDDPAVWAAQKHFFIQQN